MTQPDIASQTAPDLAVPPRVILFVDDEPFIRHLGSLTLRQHGFEVLLAEDGAQAVDVYRREGQRIDLVILDLTMPHLSGEESLRQLAAIDPEVRVLLSSGSLDANLPAPNWVQVRGVLAKPYGATELIDGVRAALG